MPEDEPTITRLLLNYRECVRAVWNGYFRHFPDGWHEFINVKHELFVGMVLVQAFDGEARSSLVRVRPHFGPKGARIMWAREQRNGGTLYCDWAEMQLREGSISLAFVEFFDWRDDGIRDLEFARAKVDQCDEAPELVGADMLLPALACDYFAVARELSMGAGGEVPPVR